MRFLRADVTASPWFTPPEPIGSRITILSGLPGSGKDRWLRENRPDLPVVSLDRIRAEMGIGPTENQGKVLQAGFEAARVNLRAGRDFAWNATCLTRLTRQKIVGLSRDYDAHIEIVSLDIPVRVALERNRGRKDAALPDRIISDLALKREPLMAEEAHVIMSVDACGKISLRHPTGATERAPPRPEGSALTPF